VLEGGDLWAVDAGDFFAVGCVGRQAPIGRALPTDGFVLES